MLKGCLRFWIPEIISVFHVLVFLRVCFWISPLSWRNEETGLISGPQELCSPAQLGHKQQRNCINDPGHQHWYTPQVTWGQKQSAMMSQPMPSTFWIWSTLACLHVPTGKKLYLFKCGHLLIRWLNFNIVQKRHQRFSNMDFINLFLFLSQTLLESICVYNHLYTVISWEIIILYILVRLNAS